jgi:hypothetical protein
MTLWIFSYEVIEMFKLYKVTLVITEVAVRTTIVQNFQGLEGLHANNKMVEW